MRLRRAEPARTDDTWEPILVAELELASGEYSGPCVGNASSQQYGRARVLVRDFGTPVDVIDVDLRNGEHLRPLSVRARAERVERDATLSRRSEPLVTVAIATRDRSRLLARCLQSLASTNYQNVETLVVDNSPRTDDTEGLVRRLSGRDPRIRYLRQDRRGVAAAQNLALAHANGEYFAITDDDVVVDPNWIVALVSAFESDPTIACVTGMIFPAELDTPAQWWIESFGGFCKGVSRVVWDERNRRPNDAMFPFAGGKFGSGANMAFRTLPFREMGGFDEALGTGTAARGGHDSAAFFDIIATGHALMYEPAALVYHTHPRDIAELNEHALSYGIGTAAYVTHIACRHPRRMLRMAIAAPMGARHMLAPSSPKNSRRPADFPRSAARRERVGFLIGVPLYLWSRIDKRVERMKHERARGARAVWSIGAAHER